MTHFICRKAPSSLRAGSQQLSYTTKRHTAGTSSQCELVVFMLTTVTEAGSTALLYISAAAMFNILTKHVGTLMSDTCCCWYCRNCCCW